MISVDENVELPPARRSSKNRITVGLRKVMDRYSAAYQKLYGVPPTITWTDPWFKVSGVSSRVSRARLLEMARQLEYRSG